MGFLKKCELCGTKCFIEKAHIVDKKDLECLLKHNITKGTRKYMTRLKNANNSNYTANYLEMSSH